MFRVMPFVFLLLHVVGAVTINLLELPKLWHLKLHIVILMVWDVVVLNASDYKLAHNRVRVFLRGIRQQFCAEMPATLPPFGKEPLRSFLAPNEPRMNRASLSFIQQANLRSMEETLKADVEHGRLIAGTPIVFSVDRGADSPGFAQLYMVDKVADHFLDPPWQL